MNSFCLCKLYSENLNPQFALIRFGKVISVNSTAAGFIVFDGPIACTDTLGSRLEYKFQFFPDDRSTIAERPLEIEDISLYRTRIPEFLCPSDLNPVSFLIKNNGSF